MTLNVLAPYRTVLHFNHFRCSKLESPLKEPHTSLKKLESWRFESSYDQWSNEPVNLRHLT